MLTSKAFVRKTKSGGVVKVVREHYLRDDVVCGSEKCESCQYPADSPPLLGAPGSSGSLIVPDSHYLIPDTNVVISQITVLEDAAISNVVILQTVLDEVRARSLPTHKKLKDIINNSDKKFYVFTNEHHREAFAQRQAGETTNERNDRAIRKAVGWYQTHLKDKMQIVLLTNDIANKEKAIADGLLAFTAKEYIESMKDHPHLYDKLSLPSEEQAEIDKMNIVYPEHLSLTAMQAKMKAGTVKTGSFMASRENYLEGFVSVEGMEEMVLIQGRVNLNRAVQDDVVVVEIFPEQEWSAPVDLIISADEGSEETHDAELSEQQEHIKKGKLSTVTKKPTGRIVGIVKRKWRQYCGMLKESTETDMRRHLFRPAERRIPFIRIETRQAKTLMGQRIVVAIDSWPKASRYPLGHFVKALGNVGDKATENEVLLLEHDVPHHKFSEKVLSYLPSMPWTISEEEEMKRMDLRDLYICSVDPPGCTDIDDALHCRVLENGNLEVGVHIADVTHFIRPGTALDAEASERSTTVYLVDQRIDMVPELLSSNLCSLLHSVDRFAFSCIWEMTADATIVDVKYGKSIIKSKASLTYAEAQLRIDDQDKQDELTLGLRRLNQLAKILKKRRLDNGALVLASPEIRFYIDSETHDPIDVVSKQMLETNSMVEEFMLLANISVAQKIFKEFPECAVLRRHPSPPLSNFEPLIKAAKSKGLEIKIDSGKALADSLDAAEVSSNPYFNTMLRIVATRCMMQAVYFCSGTISESEFHHYGLAAEIYTHFTSPIRRYADVMVHRLLAACIGADVTYPELLDKRVIQNLCNNMNYRHKMAQYAGRSSVGLHTQLFFKERIQDEEGYVLFVKQNAIQVLVPKYGLEASIFLKDEGKASGVAFEYDENEPSQRCGDVTLRVFDRVTVQLGIDRTNLQNQKLVMHLVEPNIPGFSSSPAKRTRDEEALDVQLGKKCKT